MKTHRSCTTSKKPRPYAITFQDSITGHISERFLSFTIDISCIIGGRWWGDSKGLEEGLSKDRVPPLDLGNPVLNRRAALLAPAILRVGGTEADRLHYGFDRGISPARPDGPFVLKRKRWLEICSFTKNIGMGLLFTVGAGPETRDSWGRWDGRDAARLMAYSARKGLPVDAWEFGNEVNAFPLFYGLRRGISARHYAREFEGFAALVRRYQGSALAVGPASAVWPLLGEVHPILPALCRSKAAAAIGALSFHYYPQQSSRGKAAVRRAREGTMLKPRNLDGIRHRLQIIKKHRDSGAAAGKPIWITETGHALYGGQAGLSDTWISMPWWLDQLALLASEGVDAVFRQSLTGGDYGLLDSLTWEPRPDYHVSFLWKRLIGTGVYAPPLVEGPNRKLRAWALCGKKKNAWLILINLDRNRSAKVSLDRSFRRRLILEPDQGLPSARIRLNGVAVDVDLEETWGSRETKEKYALARTGGPSREILLPPLGCAFVEVRAGDRSTKALRRLPKSLRAGTPLGLPAEE